MSDICLRRSEGACIVTGGAGFVGCAVSKDLSDHCGQVVAIDVLHPQVHAAAVRPPRLDPRVNLVVGDVTDPAVWDQVLSKVRPDLILHLAAETGTGQSLAESNRHGRTNVVGTTVMLDALTRAGHVPRRFVLASSRAVYGEGAWHAGDGKQIYPGIRSRPMLARCAWDFPGLAPLPSASDRTWPKPCNVYGATKLAQEHILSAWCAAHGAELSILRLQNVFGPGQSLTNSYTGIVALFCRIARAGGAIPVYEDGAMLRDFISIDDVATAVLEGILGPPIGSPVDIGTGNARSIGELARIIAAIYGAPRPKVTGQYRFGDVRHAACDIVPTKNVLAGWEPLRSLEDGLQDLIAWIETQQPQAVES